MPGWLGAATPESFVVEISMERPLPCHPTIDYDDPAWFDAWNCQEIGRICAGSLIMSANMCKIPRDPKFPRLPRDPQTVFATHLEFLRHHNDAPVKSWERRGDGPVPPQGSQDEASPSSRGESLTKPRPRAKSRRRRAGCH